MNVLLEHLLTNEFAISAGVVCGPSIHSWLEKQPVVQQIRLSMDHKILTEQELYSFIDYLVDDFIQGQRFPHELSLAAIMVAAKNTQVGYELIQQLSNLDIVEMEYLPKIAKKYRKEIIL